jgi:hypothetical protein
MNVPPVRPGLAVATVLCAVSVLFGPWAVAVPAGLVLGLVLPGLALTWALFPGDPVRGPASGRSSAGLSGRSSGSRGCGVNGVERVVLPPALSLAVLVTAGLVMYAAGIALDRTSWTAATVLVTLVALSVSALRRRRHGDSAWPTPPANRSEPRPADAPPRLLCPAAIPAAAAAASAPLRVGRDQGDAAPGRFAGASNVSALHAGRQPAAEIGGRSSRRRVVRQVVPLVLAVVILGAAGVFSLTDARHTADVTVTALSAAPPQSVGNGRWTVAVTASGLVAADGPYTLVVTGPSGVESMRRTLDAPGNGTWTGDLVVGPGRTSIALYRAADATPYRILYIAAGQP